MGIELGRTTGKINLTNTTGNIELNNNNGNVDLTNEKENIEFNGVSGDIELVIKGGGSSVEIDDTLSIAGAAADAAATGEAIEKVAYKLDSLPTGYDEGSMVSATNLTPDKRINLKVRNKNVFDVSTIHIGYTAESYGNGFNTGITKRANTKHCAAHDNVIVKPDTHYVFSLDNTQYWVARIIEVDKDNLCVRNHAYYATKQDNAVKEFITKETTVKLYIAFEKKDGTPAIMEEVVALNFQLEVGDTPTPFTPYVDVANREITITGKNIFKPTGGISASDFENKEIGDKMPTEFIEGIYQIHPYTPLKPNTYYTYSTQATRGQGWQGYMAKEIYEADENDIIVAKYSFTPEQPYTKFTFKTTPTTKYMLVNIGGIAFTTGTTLDEKSLKVRDFQFEEGNDESGSDFYYEEIYTTDKNGCVNGIAFPRDKAHAHIKDKGLVIELEVEEEKIEVEQIEVDATLSQPGAAADAAATGYMFKNYNAFAETTTKEFLLDTNSNGYAVHEGKLGLVIGETYTIERYIDGELVSTFEGVAEEDWYGKGCASLYANTLGDVENDIYVDYQLTDGIAYNPNESIEMYGDYYSIENWNQDDSVEEFTVYITGKFLSKIPLESMYLTNNVMDGIPFPVSSDAVSREIAALDKKVAYVVQNIGGKNGVNEILFPETKNYNRAEVRLGTFVNGKQDIYYNPNKNHLTGNGEYGFISEEGFSTFGICLTPEELRGTEGNYYVVIDIQLLTMTSTSGAVHCKIDSTFYKYGDGITSVKTERNVEDFKPYKKSIDTMYFFYGRSTFSSINRGFIYIDDGANTVFNGTSGKITYYQK